MWEKSDQKILEYELSSRSVSKTNNKIPKFFRTDFISLDVTVKKVYYPPFFNFRQSANNKQRAHPDSKQKKEIGILLLNKKINQSIDYVRGGGKFYYINWVNAGWVNLITIEHKISTKINKPCFKMSKMSTLKQNLW